MILTQVFIVNITGKLLTLVGKIRKNIKPAFNGSPAFSGPVACTVKSSKTTVSGIFRATKNLIFALNPLCTLNVKITLLYESGRYRWEGWGGQKNNVHWTLSVAMVEFRLSPNGG